SSSPPGSAGASTCSTGSSSTWWRRCACRGSWAWRRATRASAQRRARSRRSCWSAGRPAASSSASRPIGSGARARCCSPCSSTRRPPPRAPSRPTSGCSPPSASSRRSASAASGRRARAWWRRSCPGAGASPPVRCSTRARPSASSSRRRVREPEVWEREAHQAPRLAELFAPGLRHATFGGLAMCIVTLVAWWGTNAFLPLVAAFLAGPDAAPSVRAGFITYASTMFNLGGLVGTLATIPVARLGRRAPFALYLAGGAASIWVTFGGDWDPVVRMRLLFLDGLTVYGVAGTFSFYLPELFPTRLRGTGAGFCYNAGRYLAAAG